MTIFRPFLALSLTLALAACAPGQPPREPGWGQARGPYLGGGWGFFRQPPANHPGN